MNTLGFSIDFMLLIISFISSFKMNKINYFPFLTTPFLLIFLSNSFIAFVSKLLTYPGNLPLAKGIATFISVFLPELSKQEPKDLTD